MSTLTTHPNQPKRIGLLAGWGQFPLIVARSLKEQGHQVYCVGYKDHADRQLAELCDGYTELGLAKLGGAIRYFRRHGITHATMAGKVFKVLLFRKFIWLRHLPDFRCVRTFYPHFIRGTRDRKDDTILLAIVSEFGRDGIEFVPATDLVPELLVKAGTLSRRAISNAELKDIEFGWELAKKMGELDVGQSVAVKGRAVLAVEAVEGTDQCIKRAGELCPQGGFTVVKVAKPQQDMRFDVPTIGEGTLQSIVDAGGRVLAVEAEKTIILDEPSVIEFANRHGLSVVAIGRSEAIRLSDAA